MRPGSKQGDVLRTVPNLSTLCKARHVVVARRPTPKAQGRRAASNLISWMDVLLTGTGTLINRHRLIDVSCRVDPASSLDSTASASAGEGATKKGTKRGKRNTHQRRNCVSFVGCTGVPQARIRVHTPTSPAPSSRRYPGLFAWPGPGVSWRLLAARTV